MISRRGGIWIGLVAGLLCSAPALAAYGPDDVPAVDTLAHMRTINNPAVPVVFLEGTSSPGDGVQGEFWFNISSTCTDDAGQTCVQPSGLATGRWIRLPWGSANGGSTLQGGALLAGSIGQSTVNGTSVFRTDAIWEGQNIGNQHALAVLANTYVPENDTPLCTFTATIASKVMTVTATVGGCQLGPTDIVTGSGVTYRSAIVSGSGTTGIYGLNVASTVASPTTMTAFPLPQEASWAEFGLTSTGQKVQLVNLNSTWANDDNTNTSGTAVACLGVLRQNGDGTQAEGCPILAYGNQSLLLGSFAAGGDYPIISPATVAIFNNNGTTSTVLNVVRMNNNALDAALLFSTAPNYPTQTVDWQIGTSQACITSVDFCTINKNLGEDDLNISDATGNVFVRKFIILNSSGSPASGAACTAGTVEWDTGFGYICTASGAWKRFALTGSY